MTYDDVKLGSMLFTLVEPHAGHEVDFNRFYERDHFYAGMMAGPYTFSGQRWVATRDLKALRYPAGSSVIAPDRYSGAYLALYWCLDGHNDEWQRWTVDAWYELTAAGRMNFDRDRIHSVIYRFDGATLRDPEGPAPEQALDHRYPGLGAVVYESDDPEALEEWLRRDHLPAKVAASDVSQVLLFRTLPHLDDVPPGITDIAPFANCVMTLWFLDRPAADVWSAVFDEEPVALERSGNGRVVWMSPFRPTVPGTDLYADQL